MEIIRVSNQLSLIVGCLMEFKLYETLLNLHTLPPSIFFSLLL